MKSKSKSTKRVKGKKTVMAGYSKKARKGRLHKKVSSKTSGFAMKASNVDPALTANEVARVQESRQNIRNGDYTAYSSVDRMWQDAASTDLD